MNTFSDPPKPTLPVSAAGIWCVGDEQAQHLRREQFDECNARTYIESTDRAGVSAPLLAFAAAELTVGEALELGSETGRDSLWLAERGFEVLDALDRYDGIWARTALLHVAAQRHAEVRTRPYRAPRPGGALHASNRRGSGQRVVKDGRYFFHLDVPRLVNLADGIGLAEPPAQLTACATGSPTRWVSALVSKACRSGSAPSQQLEETRQ